jgi:hypothetical protein
VGQDIIIIDGRHNGPPGTGNGGWSAGLISTRLDPGGLDPGGKAGAEVTLHKPPPLEIPLSVVESGGGIEVVGPDGEVIAVAHRREADIPAVPGVPAEQAREASTRYPGHGHHHFPTCYGCGPQRPDGLRIFPGLVGEGRTAAIFEVPDEINTPMVWAALDCPGGWTVISSDHPWVLGRIAALIDGLPKPGDECVVVGQVIERSGRRALVRTSLYDPAAALLARAEATWIRIPV